MALTVLQRDVCRLLAERRRLSGESYVAGGVALNEVLAGARLSRDVDVFHDSSEALQRSWVQDLSVLRANGFTVEVVRERPSFIEALIRRHAESVVFEWSHDSAFRFFPLVEHEVLGLTMHPLDLATNKLLALVGRREPRDFVDALRCIDEVQPLALLAWAAAGKDPGWSPAAIIEEAARNARYTSLELRSLDWGATPAPDATELATRWRTHVDGARTLMPSLPADQAGTCVLDGDRLARFTTVADLETAAARGSVRFHAGTLRGAFPRPLQ